MNESKISRHLARRDRELELAQMDQEIDQETDRETDEALLVALGDIKAELNDIADVELGPRDWQLEATRLSAREQPRRASLFAQYPLATAASVLFVSALFVAGLDVDWNRGGGQVDLAEANLVTETKDPLPVLIARSQDLENLAQISGGWSGAVPTGADTDTQLTRLILMQVAAIDDRLSSLDGRGDQTRVRTLWQRRVNLLEAYNAAIENADPDLSRSM